MSVAITSVLAIRERNALRDLERRYGLEPMAARACLQCLRESGSEIERWARLLQHTGAQSAAYYLREHRLAIETAR